MQTAQRRALESCAHLESALSHAAMLEDAQDWLQTLTQYTKFLCSRHDHNRLISLCETLLGYGDNGDPAAMDVEPDGVHPSLLHNTCAARQALLCMCILACQAFLVQASA